MIKARRRWSVILNFAFCTETFANDASLLRALGKKDILHGKYLLMPSFNMVRKRLIFLILRV